MTKVAAVGLFNVFYKYLKAQRVAVLVEIKWKTKKWGNVMTKHTFSFSYCLTCTQGNRDLVFFSCCILRFLVERGNKLPCV